MASTRRPAHEELKVRLVNVKEPAEMRVVFESGILEMRCAHVLGAQGMHSDHVIRQVLEQGS